MSPSRVVEDRCLEILTHLNIFQVISRVVVGWDHQKVGDRNNIFFLMRAGIFMLRYFNVFVLSDFIFVF